jgi:hypothetical protein
MTMTLRGIDIAPSTELIASVAAGPSAVITTTGGVGRISHARRARGLLLHPTARM